MYIQTLKKLVQLMFALDHHNYARWLSIHIRDMMLLEQMHPDIFVEFCRSFFMINKTGNTFSSISVEQVHEQNNALVKGDGGPVGLTENHQAMNRWMLAGPETAQVIHLI